MANIYSHDFIKKMIDNNNIDIVNLVAQLPCVSADWMLEYAIEQKKSKIAKKLFATNETIRAKHAQNLLRLMTSDTNINNLYIMIRQNTIDPFYFIFGMDFVDEKTKSTIIDAVMSDDEINSMIKIALLDISAEKKLAIRAMCESNVMNNAAIKNTSFEFDKMTKSVRVVVDL